MTEEQNKLAEEIDVLIGRLRMHAGASDTHIPRPLLATAADALAALCEREPATEAVREPSPEQWQEFYDRVWDSDETNPTLALPTKELQRIGRALFNALKGKGASQGDGSDYSRASSSSDDLAQDQSGEQPVSNRKIPHDTGHLASGQDVSMDRPRMVAAPEPSGEFVRVPREPTDAMVWAICRASEARTGECSKCPHEIQTEGHGPGIQGCRAIAEEQYAAMLAAARKKERK